MKKKKKYPFSVIKVKDIKLLDPLVGHFEYRSLPLDLEGFIYYKRMNKLAFFEDIYNYESMGSNFESRIKVNTKNSEGKYSCIGSYGTAYDRLVHQYQEYLKFGYKRFPYLENLIGIEI